jgi:hypothetical protein
VLIFVKAQGVRDGVVLFIYCPILGVSLNHLTF